MKQTNEKTSVSAATQEENAAHSTVFDDVFRTIAQKLPQLLIPLINEVFHTNYSEDEDFEQLRNEHYEKYGKIITDSIIRISRHIYHLECQSQKDSEMVIRMFEYDISIALEHASDSGEIWEIEFPQSCVLYVRNHRTLPQYHEAIVRFSDGQQVIYRIPIIHAQHYTVNDMFEKKLLILLPYHILRYEHFLRSNKTNEKKLNQLLDDYRKINERLTDTCEKEKKSEFYTDMICLIKEIADHVIPKENEARKGVDEIMGGNILTLPSDLIREERAAGREEGLVTGREEGLATGLEKGRNDTIFSFVQDGIISVEVGADKANLSIEDFKKAMTDAGYHLPDQSK